MGTSEWIWLIEYALGYFRIQDVFLSDLNSYASLFKYNKISLLRCIHDFNSDLINNIDHMRISDTEPSSVILYPNKVA